MDPEELKAAWQSLDRRLAQQARIDLALLRESKLGGLRARLRPLAWGQVLQLLLGVALVLLGIACWKRNLDVPGYFITGIAVHAFGVATAALAGITLGLIATIDYAAPVVAIQRQLTTLRRFYTLNGMLTGLPWWIMWLPVVIAFAGLGEHPAGAGTPTWVTLNLAIGAIGLVGTWLFYLWSQKAATPALGRRMRDLASGASLRRAQAMLDELHEFAGE